MIKDYLLLGPCHEAELTALQSHHHNILCDAVGDRPDKRMLPKAPYIGGIDHSAACHLVGLAR